MASGICFAFRSSFVIGTVTILLLVFTYVSRVDAGATLKLHMIRFENPSERDYGGSCCDVFCNDCDHKFRFSLDRGNSDNNPKRSYYWTKRTRDFAGQNSISFGSNMKGVANPIVTLFNPRWPSVGVKLKVFVTDEDGRWSSDDDVDGLVQLLNPTPSRSASTASWTTITVRGQRRSHKTTLRLKYMLYCDANYYSSDCSVRCVARDSDADGHYTCDPATGAIVCRPGWEDVSTRCKTRSDDCPGHSCRNGATCVDGVRSYTCRCPPGYTGRYCEVDINECASRPCLNGGTCTVVVAGYSCTCPPEYVGHTCATPRRLCPTGFVGDDCSVNLCDLLNCQNGGSCVNESCICPPGVVGTRCDLVLCSLMMCLNGGNCSEGTCTCPVGFTGRLCEIDIDDCVDDPCQHDGTCDDLQNGFTCRCLPGYAGKICSDTISRVNNVIQEEPLEDRWNDQVDAFDVWFFASCAVIFVLLLIIVILSVCLCKQRRKEKKCQQPAPVAAAAVCEAEDNSYCSIREHKMDDNNVFDNPMYEYASPSVMEEHEC